MTVAAYVFFAIGSFCAVVGAVGIIRLPDVYNRLHGATVTVVGGVIMSVIGAGFYGGGDFLVKALIIAAFIFLTAPVGSHAIARAAHKSGVKLHEVSKIDELEQTGSERGGKTTP